LKGEFSLVYLSPDGGMRFSFLHSFVNLIASTSIALRTSSNNLDIIYGMKDNMRFREMFWPLFMLNNY
jgi:hypothetical protein